MLSARRPTLLLSSLTLLLLLWLQRAGLVLANYRHFHVANADICNNERKLLKSKTLNIGSGAAIFQLKTPPQSFQPNFYNKAKRCEIHIRAPPDHGLMAYVEEMNLRQDRTDRSCVDYVQFGQEDVLPFMTLVKSERLCGQVGDGRVVLNRQHAYDDPHGSLLVWLSVGGRKATSKWPQISVVNITLVVTAYKKACRKPPNSNYRRCSNMDHRCIWKHYFCDRHINCVFDLIPRDEDGCSYEALDRGSDGPLGSPEGKGGDDEALNVVSWTLIIVCSALVLLLVLILMMRLQRSRKCCHAPPNTAPGVLVGEFEPHTRSLSLAELNRQRHLRETESNVYVPLTTFVDNSRGPREPQQQQQQQQQQVQLQQHLPPASSEEPPPAYDDLFPPQDDDDNDDYGDDDESSVFEATPGPGELAGSAEDAGVAATVEQAVMEPMTIGEVGRAAQNEEAAPANVTKYSNSQVLRAEPPQRQTSRESNSMES